MNVLVFMSDSKFDSNLGNLLFYLRHAYPNVIFLCYDYVRGEVWQCKPDSKIEDFDTCWTPFKLTANLPDLYNGVVNQFKAVDANGDPEATEDLTTFGYLRSLLQQPLKPGDPTFIAPGNLVRQLGLDCQKILGIIMASIDVIAKDANVCFTMSPNGRNVPIALTHVGRKIGPGVAPSGLVYTHKDNRLTPLHKHDTKDKNCPPGNFGALQEKAACAKVLTEIYLCRILASAAFIESPQNKKTRKLRYLGNCYGAQIMWVALGGSTTTPIRVKESAKSIAITLIEEGGFGNFSAEDGVTLMDGLDGVHRSVALDQESMYALCGGGRKPFEIDIDYHHATMMIFAGEAPAKSMLERTTIVEHHLANRLWQGAIANTTHKKFIKYSAGKMAKDTPEAKPWTWVGIYSCSTSLIVGFQDHPLYHVTQYSGAWNAVRPSVDPPDAKSKTALNTNYKANTGFLEELMFG